MRWAAHVEFLGTMRNLVEVLVGKSEGRSQLGDIGVGGRIHPTIRWKGLVH
jgi:hypothetical protein